MSVEKFDIFLADIPRTSDTSTIIRGFRPVVVVSNDTANEHSPQVSVIPLTSQLRRSDIPTHVFLSGHGLKMDSIAKCESVMPLDKDRLKAKVGHVQPSAQRAIRNGLLSLFGMF